MAESLEAQAVEAAHILRIEQGRYTSPLHYVARLAQKYRRTVAETLLDQVADAVEPRDIVLGADPERPTAVAFCQGGIIGVRAAEIVLGRDYDKRLYDLPLPVDTADDEPDRRQRIHRLGASIVHIGDEGYAMAPEAFRGLMEDWEDSVCPSIGHQPFLRRGFGLIAYMMQGVLEQADLEKMRQELEATSADDWDTGLRQLLGA